MWHEDCRYLGVRIVQLYKELSLILYVNRVQHNQVMTFLARSFLAWAGLLTKRPNEVAAPLPVWERTCLGEEEVHHGYLHYFCCRIGQYHVPGHELVGSAVIEEMIDSFDHPFEK